MRLRIYYSLSYSFFCEQTFRERWCHKLLPGYGYILSHLSHHRNPAQKSSTQPQKAVNAFILYATTSTYVAGSMTPNGSATTETGKNFVTNSMKLPRKFFPHVISLSKQEQNFWELQFKLLGSDFIFTEKDSSVAKSDQNLRTKPLRKAYRNLKFSIHFGERDVLWWRKISFYEVCYYQFQSRGSFKNEDGVVHTLFAFEGALLPYTKLQGLVSSTAVR